MLLICFASAMARPHLVINRHREQCLTSLVGTASPNPVVRICPPPPPQPSECSFVGAGEEQQGCRVAEAYHHHRHTFAFGGKLPARNKRECFMRSAFQHCCSSSSSSCMKTMRKFFRFVFISDCFAGAHIYVTGNRAIKPLEKSSSFEMRANWSTRWISIGNSQVCGSNFVNH